MPSSLNGTGVSFNDGTTQASGQQAAKAWVNFNGVGTPSIRASYNISSVTGSGGGAYVVNFSSALADGNYCATTAGRVTSTTDGRELVSLGGSNQINPSSTQFALQTCINNIGNNIEYVFVSVFR